MSQEFDAYSKVGHVELCASKVVVFEDLEDLIQVLLVF
jgi:hypothetical protein